VDALRARLEMEAFLVEPATEGEIDSLVTAVSSLRGVENVLFISKDDAVRIFKQEFGEDITTVLDFNPLPPSLKITLTPQYVHRRERRKSTTDSSPCGGSRASCTGKHFWNSSTNGQQD